MQEFEFFRWSARDWKTASRLKEQAGAASAARVQSGTVPWVPTDRPAANGIGARSLQIPCAGSFADGPYLDAVGAVIANERRAEAADDRQVPCGGVGSVAVLKIPDAGRL